MKKLLLMFLISCSNSVYAQVDILLRDFKEYLKPHKCDEEITRYLIDSSFIKLKLSDCMGKSSIKQFDKNGVLLVAGQYIASLDTLKEYIEVFDLEGNLPRTEVSKYFQPLRDGLWIYYKPNGEVKEIKKYVRGILTNP